jgi:hypothetical protein
LAAVAALAQRRLVVAEAAGRCPGTVSTSTNASNQPTRRLLETSGWTPGGELHGLDAGDPEIFYRRER